jgi:hypothetical protein
MISAGHSGPNKAYRLEPLMELFSKFPRSAYSTAPSCCTSPNGPKIGICSVPFEVQHRWDNHTNKSRTAGVDERSFTASRSAGNRMRGDLLKKLIAQDDDVFIRLAEQAVLVSAVVPDLCFAKKIETRPLHDFGLGGYRVISKKSIRVSGAKTRRLSGRLAEPKATASHRLSGGRKSSSARADRLSAHPVQ